MLKKSNHQIEKKSFYIKYILIFVIIAASVVFAFQKDMITEAGESTISVALASTDIEKGENFTVYVKINSEAPISMIEAEFSYNSEQIEFVESESDKIVGTSGKLRLSDSFSNGATDTTYELTFMALETGESQIDVEKVFAEGAGKAEAISLGANKAIFEIGVNTDLSSNAKLKDLILADGVISPKFKSNIYQYSVIVQNQIDQLFFSSVPSNENSQVEVVKEEMLSVGHNKILIRVTAPSGAVKEYTFDVYRQTPEETAAELSKDKEEVSGEPTATVSGNPVSQEVSGNAVETLQGVLTK